MIKKFVSVISKCDTNGHITPLSILWSGKDGDKTFEIDKISDTRQAASLKSGGCGMRYTLTIKGNERYLFFDAVEKKWFIEFI